MGFFSRIKKSAARAVDDFSDRERAAQAFATSERDADLARLGYQRFEPSEMPGAEAVVALGRRLFEERCVGAAGEKRIAEATNPHLVTFSDPDDFKQYPELLDFALNDRFLEAAIPYFGYVPVLGAFRLWWSPINESVRSSQLFHLDGADDKQMKYFFNVTDVDDDTGPLHFVSREDSRRAQEKLGFKGGDKLADEMIYAAIPKENLLKATGPGGVGFGVDTSQCLHYGSRKNLKHRAVVMIQYLTVDGRIDPNGMPEIARSRYADDPVRSLMVSRSAV